MSTSAADKLPAPTLNVSAKTDTTVTISWSKVSGAEKYAVYCLKPGEAKYIKLGDTTKISCTTTKLTAKKQYKFKAAALDIKDGKTPTGTYSKVVAVTTAEAKDDSDNIIRKLFDNQQSDVAVTGSGKVTRLLTDDNDGNRHQRFILELKSGQTLLAAHNIDVATRLDGVKVGDTVEFCGEYVHNNQGSTIHWTHHDPDGSHKSGRLKWNGKVYQ
jgi:hypothetical protein